MPSAGKSVVELQTNDGRHVAWVEIGVADRPRTLTEPVVLLWGTRMFVWRTVSQRGFFVFVEACVLVSRTPSPGLSSPEGTSEELVFPPAAQDRLAEQVEAVDFGGSAPKHLSLVLVLTALRDQARAVRLTTLANLVQGDLGEVEALVNELVQQGKAERDGAWVAAVAERVHLPTRQELADLRRRIEQAPGKEGKPPGKPRSE